MTKDYDISKIDYAMRARIERAMAAGEQAVADKKRRLQRII